MKVGFIGLGTMGSSMALNIRASGYDIVVNDIRREASAPHLQAGASWRDSARDVAETVDVVFTSLPGPREVEEVALAEDGLLVGMRGGTAWFDLSTNSPTVVRRLHERFAAKGVTMLDSPVSGGPAGAKSRKLALWVSGDETVFNRHKRCSTLLEIRLRTSARLVPARWRSSYTTPRATRYSLRSPKCSHWESKPESSPSRCGRRCARGPSAAADPSTGSPNSFYPSYSIHRRSR